MKTIQEIPTFSILLPFSLIGAVFLVIALLMKYFPPKYPNMFYGYRTPSSTKNQQTWNEANKYSANIMIYVGIINIIFPLYLGYMFHDPPSDSIIIVSVAVFLISILSMIIFTELHMKKMFDSNGNPKREY